MGLKFVLPPCTAALLLFFVATSPALCSIVSFRDAATINNPQIFLADIADISSAPEKTSSLERLPIGRSPAPGSTIELNSTAIITSLQRLHNLDDVSWKGSKTISVQRTGIPITRELLEHIIADFLQQNIDKLPQAEIRFTSVRVPRDMILPHGDLSWQVTPSRPQIIGSSSFSIVLKIDGKTTKNITVRGKLEAMTKVAVAAVPLRRGDIIAPHQVTLVKKDLNRLTQPYFSEQQLVGLQVKQTINKGKVIEKRHVRPAPVIKKGDLVKIFATKGTMQISTTGIARTEGRIGERIQVKNINSAKMVYCRIDGPGQVSVEF